MIDWFRRKIVHALSRRSPRNFESHAKLLAATAVNERVRYEVMMLHKPPLGTTRRFVRVVIRYHGEIFRDLLVDAEAIDAVIDGLARAREYIVAENPWAIERSENIRALH